VIAPARVSSNVTPMCRLIHPSSLHLACHRGGRMRSVATLPQTR
jgi:hypothetical protein